MTSSSDQTPSRPDIVERTRKLAVRIVHLCDHLDALGHSARRIADQLVRSGTSIGACVHESRSAESDKDFIHKNQIALKEARETLYWIDVLADAEIVENKRLEPLRKEVDEVIRILVTIVVKTKKRAETKNDAKVEKKTSDL